MCDHIYYDKVIDKNGKTVWFGSPIRITSIHEVNDSGLYFRCGSGSLFFYFDGVDFHYPYEDLPNDSYKFENTNVEILNSN